VLREALEHLAQPRCGDAGALAADAMLCAAVERWLQLSVEACVDVASHIVSVEEWTPPANSRDTFSTLGRHGVIPADLARRLGGAVGLRNLLVHDYVEVDLDQVAAVVREDLDDLRAFAGVAAGWLDRRRQAGQ
jgi:uncharacterized protein YutE (UPF0331/DUF86 family)